MSGRHPKFFAEAVVSSRNAATVLGLAEQHGQAVQVAPDRVGLSCSDQVEAIRRRFPDLKILESKPMRRSESSAEELRPHFSISYRIERPPAAVFDALVDPRKLCSYFTKTASGRLESGARVEWTFRDSSEVFSVSVEEVSTPQLLQFSWGPRNIRVRFELAPVDGSATRISVRASGWEADEASLADSYQECAGWQEVLCSTRAELQHEIDL